MYSHAQVAHLPPHRADGYLPDFLAGPAAEGRSPFLVTAIHLVEIYGQTAKRREFLVGFFGYRDRLRRAGLVGVQWLNGSFVGDVERRENRDPGDIDVVTWYSSQRNQLELRTADPSLWNRDAIKAQHFVDAFPICANQPPYLLLTMACYWHGMWSRSKKDSIPTMKGYVALELSDSDAADKAALDRIQKLGAAS